MASPDKIPGGGATEAEAGSKLTPSDIALVELIKSAAGGDEMASLALNSVNDLQLSVQRGLGAGLKAQEDVFERMAGRGTDTQEPNP